MLGLPDRSGLLALRPDGQREAARLLGRIDPAVAHVERVIVSQEEATTTAMSLGQLFANQRMIGTLLLWVIFGMSLFDISIVASWLPTVLHAGAPRCNDRRSPARSFRWAASPARWR